MSSNPFIGIDPRDLVSLTSALIDVPSVSLDEDLICSLLIEYVEHTRNDAKIIRVNNSFVAQINVTPGAEPVIFAGHLDTVPVAIFEGQENSKARIIGDKLFGVGASDMKSGVAIMLALIAEIDIPSTFVFYEAEEIQADLSGLLKIQKFDPKLLQGQWAILLEPTNAELELGCQGTVSVKAIFNGKRAHSARPWMGENAIHKSAKTLAKAVESSESQPKLEVQGLTYSATLQVTTMSAGIARNVIPDRCEFVINHRYTPDVSAKEAQDYVVNEICSDADEIEIVDNTPGAMPALDHPLVAFAREQNREVLAKVAWTDVARFYEFGVGALNCGPGDATYAHRADEHIEIIKLEETYEFLKSFLSQLGESGGRTTAS